MSEMHQLSPSHFNPTPLLFEEEEDNWCISDMKVEVRGGPPVIHLLQMLEESIKVCFAHRFE